jgi:hypothetical protein
MNRRIALGLIVMVSVACASGGGSTGAPRRNPELITRAEIEATDALTALEVVQQLRPTFLRPPGQSDPVVVYVDGVRRGNISELRSLQRSSLEQIRYINANDATLRWGTGHRSGAIEVTTRR